MSIIGTGTIQDGMLSARRCLGNVVPSPFSSICLLLLCRSGRSQSRDPPGNQAQSRQAKAWSLWKFMSAGVNRVLDANAASQILRKQSPWHEQGWEGPADPSPVLILWSTHGTSRFSKTRGLRYGARFAMLKPRR